MLFSIADLADLNDFENHGSNSVVLNLPNAANLSYSFSCCGNLTVKLLLLLIYLITVIFLLL